MIFSRILFRLIAFSFILNISSGKILSFIFFDLIFVYNFKKILISLRSCLEYHKCACDFYIKQVSNHIIYLNNCNALIGIFILHISYFEKCKN